MRFLHAAARESAEAATIPPRWGKTLAPFGAVTLGDATTLDAGEVELYRLGDRQLAIVPDSAAWVFASDREAALLEGLATPRTFAWLRDAWPADAPGSPEGFAATLFRRGMLRVGGTVAVDRTMFDDGPNYDEGNLVELLLTEKCNLACGYCLAGTNPHMPTMTPEIGRAAVDRAFAMHEAPSITFEFSGGEPFMQFPLMRELADYALTHPRRNGTGVHFCVQTNLTLLDDERVEWLKRHQVAVGVSLDGDPSQHDRSRPTLGGKPSFRKVLQGLDLLQKHGVPFGALVVLNRFNAGNARQLVEFLLDNEIRAVKINPIAYLGTGRSAWDEYGLTGEECVAYFRDLLELLVAERHKLREDNLATMCRYLVSKSRTTRCMRTHCGAGESFQCVSASGDVYPCGRSSQTPAWNLGNVLEMAGSLSDAGRANPFVQQIRVRRPRDLEGCVSCPYRQMCQAGCSAEAFERYGTVRHRTPECHFFKTLYPWLMSRLSFDPEATAWLAHCGYFGGDIAVAEQVFA
jgi:uncharacterized protein